MALTTGPKKKRKPSEGSSLVLPISNLPPPQEQFTAAKKKDLKK